MTRSLSRKISRSASWGKCSGLVCRNYSTRWFIDRCVLNFIAARSTFTYNLHEFGLSRQFCVDFLRKQVTIANLPQGNLLNYLPD